jgi:hypothetical protein
MACKRFRKVSVTSHHVGRFPTTTGVTMRAVTGTRDTGRREAVLTDLAGRKASGIVGLNLREKTHADFAGGSTRRALLNVRRMLQPSGPFV